MLDHYINVYLFVKLRLLEKSLLVWKIILFLKMLFLNLGSCNALYIGKTFRHMKIRVPEHQGVSPRTGKHLKGTLSTSVKDHMLDYNHIVAWHDFKILGRESNHWLVEIRESLFIKRDRPSLNKSIYFQESFLFYFYDVRYKILIAFICCYWLRFL